MTDIVYNKKFPVILISIEDLQAGGAQVFALRFAAYCQLKGHKVFLFHHYSWLHDKQLANNLIPGVEILSNTDLPVWLDYLFFRFENLLNRNLFGRFHPRKKVLSRSLKSYIINKNISAVFSHTIKSDYVCANALSQLPVPFTITMHGDYEEFYEKIKLDQKVLNNYLSFIRTTYAEIDVIGYLSDRNLISLKLAGKYPDLITQRIYNGFYGLYKDNRSRAEIRKELGIPEEAVVFVMVARVVEGKGWAELIEAFNNINAQNTWLLLIGDGPALNELKQNNKNTRIVFTGNHSNPIDLVKVSDVGVLPSKFRESLPNSIMEYLFCGVPVIATAVGEIPYMLNVNEAPAGIAITFPDTEENGTAYKEELYSAMKLMLNVQEYHKYKKNTESAFKRFDMETCYQQYFQLLNRS